MTPFIVGIIIAVIVIIQARVMKFDKSRSYYTSMLIIIPTYYVLFAFMSEEAILIEIVIAIFFTIIATIGALFYPILIGVGLLAHGIFDFLHPYFIVNSGVPLWWPAFCAGADIILGVWIMYLVISKKGLQLKSNIQD